MPEGPEASGKLRLRRLDPDDAGFLAALDDAGMPRDDLTASDGVYFAIVDKDGRPRGYCGYEQIGDGIALIRSCVVPEPHRGKGVGLTLVGRLVARLSADGFHDLYLLTMDADPFFGKLGFALIPRDQAPDEIRATSQFTLDACKGAVLMRRAE